MWTKRLKLTQLAQSTLPFGSLRVNLIETATHVVPTAEYWRTGVQIPPAPPIRSINKTRLVRVLLFLEDGNPSQRAFGLFLQDVAPLVHCSHSTDMTNLLSSLQNQRPGLAARLISRPATPPSAQHLLDYVMAAVREALSGARGSLIPGLLTRVQVLPCFD